MSAVPDNPASPESYSSAPASSSSGIRSASHSTRPGSTLPERVAITSPSSGVKPIVVSTERPPWTAHSDAPAPRWQTMTRSAPVRSRARREAYACESPWKPKRRSGQRSRHARGSA